MGRKCSVLGCHNSTGLHCFPRSNSELLSQWLRACGQDENTKLPIRAGVCNEHFTPDAFSNWYEVKTGFAKNLLLNHDAIPTLTLPRHPLPGQRLPLLLPRFEPKGPVDVGCQTDQVLTKHAFVQANRRPPFRSTAIQARAPSRSVYCDTQGLMKSPEASCTPERSTKRRQEESDSDSSSTSNESVSCTSKDITQFIVDEDKLMALFVRCPICSSICEVSKTRTRTLLCIKQHCGFCDTSNEWFSHG